MKFTEAISILQGLEIENKDEIIKAIQSRTKAAGELEKKVSELEGNINTLVEMAGAEGDDLAKKLESAQGKIKSLSEASTSNQQALEAKDKEISQLKRQGLIQSAASKAGAKAEVLARLLGEEELAIADDGVKVGDKLLKDYASEKWSDFLPALFPGEVKSPELPSGSAKGKALTEDTAQAYLKSSYGKTLEALKKA